MSDKEFKAWAQGVFNRVYHGLESQNWERSWSKESNTCAYRGNAGRKCAIGHLISDEEIARYSNSQNLDADEFNSSPYDDLDSTFDVVRQAKRFNSGGYFLSALQDAHDRIPLPKVGMKRRLVRVALDYGLQVPNHV